jgi:hypothetical protein
MGLCLGCRLTGGSSGGKHSVDALIGRLISTGFRVLAGLATSGSS